ncbi:MAG: hypothetical protein AAB919_00540 [Patescibacteria group bacterium]
MAYRFGTLKTDGSPEATAHNAQWLGESTLGVEVVMEPLARECKLGNIDPQHRGAGGSSAIERAMIFPLPPEGSTIVTQRVDKDSIGAMAVLELRAEGREKDIDPFLVARLGAMDREGYTAHSANAIDAAYAESKDTTDALNAIIHDQGKWRNLPAKIRGFKMILVRDMPVQEIASIAATKSRLSERYNARDHRVEMFGTKVAFIDAPGKYYEARDWGNRRYEVVVVHDAEHDTPAAGLHKRWTICRKPDTFDRNRCEALLNAAEARARDMTVEDLVSAGFSWGGPKNIISSTEGKLRQSILTKDDIMPIVVECAESGLFT